MEEMPYLNRDEIKKVIEGLTKKEQKIATDFLSQNCQGI